MTGTVKWFNGTKGYGFIVPDEGGNDLFFHRSEIRPDSGTILDEGQKVEYEIGESKKGTCAIKVQRCSD